MTRLAPRLAHTHVPVFPCNVSEACPEPVSLSHGTDCVLNDGGCFTLTVDRTHSTHRSLPTAQSPLHHSNSSSCLARSRGELVCVGARRRTTRWYSTCTVSASYCHSERAAEDVKLSELNPWFNYSTFGMLAKINVQIVNDLLLISQVIVALKNNKEILTWQYSPLTMCKSA